MIDLLNLNREDLNVMTTPPKAKIYTKTGDKGSTRLVDGSCVEKFNPRVEAYGCVDELNSYIGVVRASYLRKLPALQELDPQFEKIQSELFNIGSLLACGDEKILVKLPQVLAEDIEFLEKHIDIFTAQLPELHNFVLPTGHECAAHLHVARTSCRRAERRSAEIAVTVDHYAHCLMYLNRLSDYLFVVARWVNLKTNEVEVLWKPRG